jgi:2-desacetyl-2-hydroxyethyl bacteriochlorophyllide A dehydrogenase
LKHNFDKNVTTKMKAIQIDKPGDFKIVEIHIPKPKEDEILIQVKATSLCNQHDWKVNNGLYNDLIYLEYGMPGFPGHEGAGIVVEVGNNVKDFLVGDSVVMSGLGGPPLYAEYVTRKVEFVARVKKNVLFRNIAMAELFGCVHRACNKIESYKNKSVVVTGCGAGGLAAIQICKVYGAGKITAIDIQEERLELAAELGADTVLKANDLNAVEALKNNGADIVIECSGNKTAYQNAFYIAREAIVIFGFTQGKLDVPLWQMFDNELTIYNSKWLTNQDLQSVVDLISEGKINTKKMISLETDFEHYLDAVEEIGKGEIIKAIMVP